MLIQLVDLSRCLGTIMFCRLLSIYLFPGLDQTFPPFNLVVSLGSTPLPLSFKIYKLIRLIIALFWKENEYKFPLKVTFFSRNSIEKMNGSRICTRFCEREHSCASYALLVRTRFRDCYEAASLSDITVVNNRESLRKKCLGLWMIWSESPNFLFSEIVWHEILFCSLFE